MAGAGKRPIGEISVCPSTRRSERERHRVTRQSEFGPLLRRGADLDIDALLQNRYERMTGVLQRGRRMAHGRQTGRSRP